MKILITGICGFVGSSLARNLRETFEGTSIYGIDNLSRPGSQLNFESLTQDGFNVEVGDIRNTEDLNRLPAPNWVIDAAAEPSVLAGLNQGSRQLMDINLVGSLNLLEFCKNHQAGLILLSTSRVYSIESLTTLPLKAKEGAYTLDETKTLPLGVSSAGISELFSTTPPLSLYGVSKLTSELLALEYRDAFNIPVWINRCGVIGGAGQFGKADQGIFAFWVHSWKEQLPLKYIGFGGEGLQVRDCLHPQDLSRLIAMQLQVGIDKSRPALANVSGGYRNALSLQQISSLCADRFGSKVIQSEKAGRPFDIPWCILDSSSASNSWDWKPEISVQQIVHEIADFAETQTEWIHTVSSKP